jgi:addiction module HigA family antidote
MPMKSPPHPGGALRDDLDALGLTVAEGAKALAITRQQLYKVLRGESAVSAEMAVRLEQVIGGSADHWLRLQGAYDLAQVRRTKSIRLQRIEAPPAA